MWHPWRELRSLGEDVVFEQVDLPSGDAWWVPRHRVVLMRPGLPQVERRCALSHELGHRALGHTGQCRYADADRQAGRAELEADHWAARRLITVEALAEVLVWTDDRNEAADELWVTRRILDVRLEFIHPSDWARVRRLVQQREGHHDEDDHHAGHRGGDAGADQLQRRRGDGRGDRLRGPGQAAAGRP